MSHHYSGPDYGFPHGDARLDLTDLCAFPTPGEAGRSILIMNVHPSVSVSPPGPTTPEPFSHDAVYEIRLDTDGDLRADVAFRIRFSTFERGVQSATVRRGGRAGAHARRRRPGRHRRGAGLDGRRGARHRVGWLSLLRRLAQRAVLLRHGRRDRRDEAHRQGLLRRGGRLQHRPRNSGRRARGAEGRAVGADRRRSRRALDAGGARGAAVAVRLPHRRREAAYFAAEPVDDARFVAVYAHSLEHTGGYAPDAAVRVAHTLLPDVLSYTPALPASYPVNGRALLDDVMDGFISILTNGRVREDGVGPHSDLLTAFPYVGPPHRAR